MRTTTVFAALFLAGGACMSEGDPFDRDDGRSDDFTDDDVAEDDDAAIALASCFIRPGTDNFFDPNELRCSFSTDLFGSGTSINVIGEDQCMPFSSGLFVDRIVSDEPQLITQLIMAHNTCPGRTTPFPLTAQVRFPSSPLSPRGMALTWSFTIESADQATEEAPLRGEIPARRWIVEIDNQLDAARFALVTVADSEISLGDLRGRPHSSDDPTEVDSVTVSYDPLVFRTPGPEGEVQEIEVFVPLDAPEPPTAEVQIAGESRIVELRGGGRYVLDDVGLERVPMR